MRDQDEPLPPLGIVPVTGRGSLVFALLHGESLVGCASWALGGAGVDLVDFNVAWEQVRSSERSLVVHDPLCPLTPPVFLRAAIARSQQTGTVVVGELPPGSIASPVVIPADVLALLVDEPDLDDLAALVMDLRERGATVTTLVAPRSAARVVGAEDLADLADLGDLADLSDPGDPGDLPVESWPS